MYLKSRANQNSCVPKSGEGTAGPGRFTAAGKAAAIVRQLQCDSDCQANARMPAVVKVVPIVITDVDVIGGIPICRPVFRPRIHQHERKAAVRETRIPHVHRRAGHPEIVLTSEIETEAVLRNEVTAIASTLRPSAMIAVPVLSTILLECAMRLPGAMLLPSPLLLPCNCLLLRTLQLLLGLLGTLWLLLLLSGLRVLLLLLLLGSLLLLLSGLRVLLLLLRLLGPLLLLLLSGLCTLLLLLRLLGPLLLLLLSGLRALLLLRLLGPLLLLLLSGLCALLLRLTLFFVLLTLRVRRDNRPEEQKQGGSASGSNELHNGHLR